MTAGQSDWPLTTRMCRWHLKWHRSSLQECVRISLMSALASAGTLVRFVSVMCYFKVGNSDSDCTILQYSTYHLKVSRQSPVFIVLLLSVCSVIIRVCFSFEIQNSEMCRNEEGHFFHLVIIPVKNNRLLCLTVPRFLGKTGLRDWLINDRAALEGAPRAALRPAPPTGRGAFSGQLPRVRNLPAGFFLRPRHRKIRGGRIVCPIQGSGRKG